MLESSISAEELGLTKRRYDMRLECEKLEECEATPELIRELVRNGDRRGEFMIMMRDDNKGWRSLIKYGQH